MKRKLINPFVDAEYSDPTVITNNKNVLTSINPSQTLLGVLTVGSTGNVKIDGQQGKIFIGGVEVTP